MNLWKNTKLLMWSALILISAQTQLSAKHADNPTANFSDEDAKADEPLTPLQERYGKNDKVICVTIPKAGTHLLIKCLTLLQFDGITYNYNTEKKIGRRRAFPFEKTTPISYGDIAFSRFIRRLEKNQKLRTSFLVHLPFDKKYQDFFNQCTYKNFLMVRDPRAQLISLASVTLENPEQRDSPALIPTLLDLLDGGRRVKPFMPRHHGSDLMWSIGIVKFYNKFLRWEEEPNFHVVHFENLVGPEGGGTIEDQTKEIELIANHLGHRVSDEKMQYVMDHLYGETRTFKKGQADAWRKYFTPEVVAAFKAVPGACQLLIDLGYEKDDNW